jgi:hypothetical protein
MRDNMLKQRDDGSEAARWDIMGFRYAPSHYIPAQKPQIVRKNVSSNIDKITVAVPLRSSYSDKR